MSMDWTPEQIAAAIDALDVEHDAVRHFHASECCMELAAYAEAVLSSVDLSDHDRAVARAAQPRPDHDYCAWCGWSRERDDSDVDHLRAHVMECPEHPLRLGSDSRDQAVAADALRQAADSLDNLRDSNEYDDPYVRGITRAFHRGIDRSQERLRARGEFFSSAAYKQGAADALRQAADAAADNCARALNDDDPTEANRWADTEHWLRARAAAVTDE